MNINEIFYSIQGEGQLVGLPTIFIRTSGCNLRCTYCDTTYAYEEGTRMSSRKILTTIKKWGCKRICLTGGEPLLQTETRSLITHLLDAGYEVSLETNGSQDISSLVTRSNLMISLDIKCPSSHMHPHMLLENITHLRPCDQLKFVIGDKKDYTYAKKIIKDYSPPCPSIMQSWTGEPHLIAEWILQDQIDIRVGIQLHKILWGNKRGV